MIEVKLNLGCSTDRKEGWTNIDVCPGPEVDFVMDLRTTWKYADGVVDRIYAKDVFEHVDNSLFRGNRGKIWVLNEAWRVLKPGGVLEFLVPCVHLSDGRVNPGAFADPTHVSFWTMDDHYYFCEKWLDPIKGERGRLGPSYGVEAVFREKVWELQEYGNAHEKRSKVRAVWEAVK